MVYVKIPQTISTFNLETEEIETEKKYINAIVNTSFKVFEKWEKEGFKDKFKQNLDVALATLINEGIKFDSENIEKLCAVLFSFIDIKTETPDFESFKDLMDIDNIDEIIRILTIVFNELQKSNTKLKNV